MSADLSHALEANREVLASLDREEAVLDAEDAVLKERQKAISVRRYEIHERRQVLQLAATFYREYLGAPIPTDPLPLPVPPDTTCVSTAETESAPPTHLVSRKSRARIGPQRYRMLALLRSESRPLDEADIASRTGLGIKRVRDQIRADLPDRIIAISEGLFGGVAGYEITPDGLDLMARFEAYKKAKGQPLPSLEGPIGEDGEEVNADPEREERMAA